MTLLLLACIGSDDCWVYLLGTCQKLAGGEGGSQLFEPQKKEGVMKNGQLKGEGHANICP